MEDVTQSEEVSLSEHSDLSDAPNDNREIVNTKCTQLECSCEHAHSTHYFEKFQKKLKMFEEEQELLNSSLCALTTHFAQVQFRLRQAVTSPQADKESLLKSLEEFAFRGVPDVGVVRERIEEANFTDTIWLRRVQQQQLIEKLKFQFHELDQYISKCRIPAEVLETQKIIFNKLKLRMNFELYEQKYYRLTEADIQQQADVALITKEHLVTQLKTQIADLEKYVKYLHSTIKKQNGNCGCGCTFHFVQKSPKKDLLGLVKRTTSLLHMFAIIYLGWGLRQQTTKKKLNHWGDLRAKLEMAIVRVLKSVKKCEADKSLQTGEYGSDNEFISIVSHVEVVRAVRNHLAICIRDLMQHGAREEAQIYRLVSFIGCFRRRLKVSDAPFHAWNIILQYYHLKRGEKFNSTPTRKLSRSFKLNIVESSGTSHMHNMLITIGDIISTHSLHKQSYDSHFKAFISASLNSRKLVTWLSLIFQCRTLLEMHYYSWSYAMQTGFIDSLRSLDALTDLTFNLPIDLAIRRYQTIEDAFV